MESRELPISHEMDTPPISRVGKCIGEKIDEEVRLRVLHR
jgi:hypothetical protein